MAHTPGPWYIQPNGGCRFVGGNTPSGMPVICELRDKSLGLYYSADVQDANARLIAAAPDLLAVLQSLAASFETCLASPPSTRAVCREVTEINLKFARAAIAKATGERADG